MVRLLPLSFWVTVFTLMGYSTWSPPLHVHSSTEARHIDVAQTIVRAIFGPPETRNFGVHYWDGTVEHASQGNTFTLVLNSPSALRRMFLPPRERALTEAYIFGDIDILGDIESAAAIGTDIITRYGTVTQWAQLATHVFPLLFQLPAPSSPSSVVMGRRLDATLGYRHRHSQVRDARAIRFHYDVGNDFYKLWLDERMVYSCAYFERGDESLDTAQRAKLEYLCRKLDLQAGDTLLDIGCGWGGFITYAATHYGVNVLGVTLSPAQAEVAQQRIEAAGVSERCRVEVRDYRALPRTERFTKIVSVGMVEHVGEDHLPEYFDTIYQMLEPGGMFLNHGIINIEGARRTSWRSRIGHRLWGRGEFINTYVFPDGQLVPLASMLAKAERVGFEIRDVENLREHYALTLRHWVRRLEGMHEAATQFVGEPTYRVWRLYMGASAHAFASGRIGLAQSLLIKPTLGRSGLPLTRQRWYERPLLDSAN
jgi:cyclopropane-fatty-acyl-phospholipid synthase